MTLTLLTKDPWWWHLPVVGLTRDQQASRRWTARNAAALVAGCKCGQPATHVELDHSNMGSAPVERWTCDAHIVVNQWQGDGCGGWTPVV